MSKKNTLLELKSQEEIDHEQHEQRYRHFRKTVLWQVAFSMLFFAGFILWIINL